MAEVKSPPNEAAAQRSVGLELRLEQGRAYACLSERPIIDGARVVDLAMEVPDVRFPFNVGLGAGQFSRRLCELSHVEVALGQVLLARLAERLDLTAAGISSLSLALRSRLVEGAGRLDGGVPFTFQAGIEPGDDSLLSVIVYETRFYGLPAMPAAAISQLLSRAAKGLAQQERAALRFDPLPAVLRRLLPPRGWKLPRTESVHLASASVSPGELRLVWERGQKLSPQVAAPPDGPLAPPVPPPIGGRMAARPDGAPPSGARAAAHERTPIAPMDEGLLAAIEGARAFQEAEELLFQEDWEGAREAYLANGTATSHPFAAARLLSLLVLDPRFHDEALDLAAHWLSRRPDFAAALLTEGVLRQRRGENVRAARAFAELAATSARRGEEFGALAAAEACFSLGEETDPAAAARAVETALSLRRDHLPALRTLLSVSERTGDRESLLRACRRLAAYAPDDLEKAHAHARLAEMLLRTDPPSARLHLDQALRLAPDDVASLTALARACEEGGEHLRALRAYDRLREIQLTRRERDAAVRTALTVGALWEEKLGHPENALLRYREACDLAPESAEVRERTARVADLLGHWTEAADHYAALLASLSSGQTEGMERAAHAHRALARIAEERLGDPARAASHLEAVLALEPQDTTLLERLAAIYRTMERPAELLGVLDRLIPITPGHPEQAQLLAEAGATCISLGLPDAAHGRFVAALAHDPHCRQALEGLRQIAFQRGDSQAEREALSKLVLITQKSTEQAALYDQLAGACERMGDLAAAGRAVASARRAEPTYARLTDAVRLARLASDGPTLASLLAEQAAFARTSGEPSIAVGAWMERASLLAASDTAAALASLSEARNIVPGDPTVLQAQADLAESAGNRMLALDALHALLVAGAPEPGAIELRAARLAKEAGELQTAREHAERAFDAGEPAAATLLGEILEASGDRAGQAALLERIGRLFDAAQKWAEIGLPDRARAALERAAEDPATAHRALATLAEMLLAAGDRPGAAGTLLRQARLCKGAEGARIALRAAETEPAIAGEALDQAVAIDPGFLPARIARARQIVKRDPARALSDCAAIFESPASADVLSSPDRRQLRRLAASLAQQLDRGDEARHHLLRYCEEAPEDQDALLELAQLARAASDEPTLAAALERRLTHARGAEATGIRVELARLRLRRGGAAEALELLRQALANDPTNPSALEVILGSELQGHLSPTDRAELLAKLASLPVLSEPHRAQALLERARILATLDAPGSRTAALQAAKEALRLSPRSAAALELVAELARDGGELRTAAEALLTRSRLARDANEADAATRLALAGHAAIAAELPGPGEEALRTALALGLDRDETRLVWAALAEQARLRQDPAAERAALEPLLPLLRTGERPARLVRLSALQLAQGELEAARRSADEARLLAPRDLTAIDAGRKVAEQQGDRAAVADRLAEAAALAPECAGRWLLERARILVDLGRAEEVDRTYVDALARLAPDAGLAAEHAHWRSQAPSPIGKLLWSEPLETFASRTLDPHAAAVALRDAAQLALHQGEQGAALRCARHAYARTQEEPDFAGPLLARLLYLQGSGSEALTLHHQLFEAGFPGIEDGERVLLCRQLAELAEDAGERELAHAALERLLAIVPQDHEAAERQFRLDADRARAVRTLAEHAAAFRSARRRARLLSLAAVAAHRELADLTLADSLWRKAAAAAGDYPKMLAELESARLEAARRDYDPVSPQVPVELLSAIHDAAIARESAQDRDAQRTLLEEAVELETRHGLMDEAVADLRTLEELALAMSEAPLAANYARRAGFLILERTRDPDRAEVELRRAIRRNRNDDLSWRGLEAIARARGMAGTALLAEVLAARAELAHNPEAKADLLTSLGKVLAGPLHQPSRAVAALRGALALVTDHPIAREELARVYRTLGRPVDLSQLLLERAARSPDPSERLALYREAAQLLSALPEVESRVQAANAYLSALAEAPEDLALARPAVKLLLELGRHQEAIPYLAALVRADSDDDEHASELLKAYAGRPLDQAQLWHERAKAAHGELRAKRLLQAADLLFSLEEDEQARALLVEAFDAWPVDDRSYQEALREAVGDIDRLRSVLLTRAKAVPADAAGCHRALADALSAFGRTEEAFGAYQACLASSPNDPVALAAVAERVAEQEGNGAAAELDARLLSLAESTPGAVPPAAEARARYRAGLLAWSQGDAESAMRHLEKALATAPSDPLAGAALAAVANGYAWRGLGAEALHAARRRVDRASELELDEERREALEAGVALSAQFVDQGEDAIAMLEGLVALKLGQGPEASSELDSLLDRALDALLRAGENTRASALLAMAARGAVSARRKGLLLRMGELALSRGDRLACRAAWAEAQSLDPADASLREKRLAEARDSGDTQGYAAVLEDSLAAGEPTPEVVLEMARARLALGDPAAAAAWYQRLIDFGPSVPGFVEALRVVEAQSPPDQDDRAMATRHQLRAHAAQTPELQAEEHLAAAVRLESAGAPVEEIRNEIESACAATPDDLAGWKALADFEERKGEPLAAARAYLALAIRAEGEEAVQAALRAASVFEEAGRGADALRAYAAAVHVRPGDLSARQALARLAMNSGDPATAAEHLAAVDLSAIPPADLLDLLRARARALDGAARTDEAIPLWRKLFAADSAELEAYDRLALWSHERHQYEEWLELTAHHDAAMAAAGNKSRRRDIRCERARLFEEMGRLEAAEGAWRAAIELDSEFAPAREGLRALMENTAAWTHAAERLRLEAEQSSNAQEASALLVRRARILQEKLSDTSAAAEALEAASERARQGAPSESQPAEAAPPAEPTEELTAEAAPLDLTESLAAEFPQAESATEEAVAEPPPSVELTESLAAEFAATPEEAGGEPPLEPLPQPEPIEELISESALSLESAGEVAPELPPEFEPTEELALEPAPAIEPTEEFAPEPPHLEPTEELALEPAPATEPTEEFAPEPPHLEPTEELALEPAPATEPAEEPAPEPPHLEPTEELALEPAPATEPAEEPAPEPPHLEPTEELALEPAPAIEPAEEPAPAPPPLNLFEEFVPQPPPPAEASGESSPELPPPLDLSESLAAQFETPSTPEGGKIAEPAPPLEELTGPAQEAIEPPADLGLEGTSPAPPPESAASQPPAPEPLEADFGLEVDVDDLDMGQQPAPAPAPATPSEAELENLLAAARHSPNDLSALEGLAARCRELAQSNRPPQPAVALMERARIVDALARHASPSRPAGDPPPLALRIAPELRAKVATPGAMGSMGQLLSLLSPWLEGLFPADLARRGVSSTDRIGPANAPSLLARVESAERALSARNVAVFLSHRPGVKAVLENTQPPSLILNESAMRSLRPSALAFLLARELELCRSGWALIGKFAPRDVGILCELACRFAETEPPSLGLPPQRAGAFLSALSGRVPPAVRAQAVDLGKNAAAELKEVDLLALANALLQTSNRMALLYTGEPYGALEALSWLKGESAEGGGPAHAREVLDLQHFALSDLFLELRLLLVG